MKSLETLITVILHEEGDRCAVDTRRDGETISTRLKGEGLRFLTLTLPTLAEGLETALEQEKVTPDLFLDFKKRQNLPIFMGGFFELIFDRTDGGILDNPSTDAIRAIRQVSLLLKKVELDCAPEVIQSAYDKYVQCDSEVREWEQQVPLDDLVRFQRMGSLLFSGLFTHVDRKVRSFELSPKHGGGATADKLVGNYKFEQRMWTTRLEDVFPFWRYSTTCGYSSQGYSMLDIREPGDELPVKVVHVPKTLKTPRIIAEEPTCMQYVQQGLMRSLRDYVDRTFLSSLIGTRDQEPNQFMAWRGSLDGSLATLDLSEASDRVSNLLVTTLMAHWPHLNDAVQASRSLTADVRGHGVIPLSRFASMGSALTFPVETFVFLTIVLLGIEDAYSLRFMNKEHVASLIGSVRIYGDDIVIPVEAVDHVISALNSYGFKVNERKSFWKGYFRESCGKEYYRGVDVSVVKIRRLFPSSRDDCEEMISTVSLRNQLYWHGLWGATAWMDEYLSGIIPFPVVSISSTVLGRHSVLGLPDYVVGGRYQVPLVKGMVPRYRRRYTPIDGYAALLKAFSSIRYDPFTTDHGEPSEPRGWWDPLVNEKDHLQRSGRPEAAALHLRKAPA